MKPAIRFHQQGITFHLCQTEGDDNSLIVVVLDQGGLPVAVGTENADPEALAAFNTVTLFMGSFAPDERIPISEATANPEYLAAFNTLSAFVERLVREMAS